MFQCSTYTHQVTKLDPLARRDIGPVPLDVSLIDGGHLPPKANLEADFDKDEVLAFVDLELHLARMDLRYFRASVTAFATSSSASATA